MCVSINGPFDLEIGTLVASNVGKLHSEFGHARPLVLELFAMYATDGETDGQNQRLLPLSYGRGHNKSVERMVLLNNVMRRTSITLIHISIQNINKFRMRHRQLYP